MLILNLTAATRFRQKAGKDVKHSQSSCVELLLRKKLNAKKNLFRDWRVKHSNKGNKDTEVSNLRGNSQTLLFYLLTSSISSKFSSWSWGYLASVLKDIPIFLQIAPTSGLTNVCRKDILSFKTDCRLL